MKGRGRNEPGLSTVFGRVARLKSAYGVANTPRPLMKIGVPPATRRTQGRFLLDLRQCIGENTYGYSKLSTLTVPQAKADTLRCRFIPSDWKG